MNRARPILPSLTDAQRAHALARLDEDIDRSGGSDACWPWTGGSVVRGYGVFWTSGGAKVRRMVKAHRLVYEVATGESPPTIDHRCHDWADCAGGDTCPHRLCCNPAHLVSATLAENVARARAGNRRDQCRRGHRMDPDNTYIAPDGARRCRACANLLQRETRAAFWATQPLRARPRHYRPRGMTRAALVDWALGSQSGDGCWHWSTSSASANGTVDVRVGDRMIGAHRLVYEVRVGQIPAGHVIDHTCHNPATCEGGSGCPHRACVNPAHLAAVPPAINGSATRSSRKRPAECAHGHTFTPDNTYVDKRGARHCLTCSARRLRESRARWKERTGWVDARFTRGDGKCRNGHDLARHGFTSSDGRLRCRQCHRDRNAEYRARRKDRARVSV